MRQSSNDEISTVPSGSTVILTQVVALLSKKDPKAREQAYNMLDACCREPIKCYFIAKWRHNEDHADDLCQDTFVRVWRNLDKFLPENVRHLNNWLYKIADSVAIDYLRKRNKPMVYLSQAESGADSWFDELTDELTTGGLENRIDLIDLPNELLQLPQQQQDIARALLEGLNQKEIAEQLGKSAPTVNAYVKRAREELRKKSKSFTVPADIEERQRVSREIDRVIDLTLSRTIEIYNNVQHTPPKEKVIYDPISSVYSLAEEVETEVMANLEGYWDNVIDEYFAGVALGETIIRDSAHEELTAQEMETLKESDQTSRDLERYYDRTYRKTLRRILIDVENRRRGILSDTAVLGACGQYLF